jgi:hypothetical protein
MQIMSQFSINTAKALLKFASLDKMRPDVYGIGITAQGLAATDGFAAVSFLLGHANHAFVGQVLDRKLFETNVKLAAVTKSSLRLNCFTVVNGVKFPDIFSVIPDIESDFTPGNVVDINPGYLALLQLVSLACETNRVSLRPVKCGAPLRFDVQEESQSAIVIINPVRK